MISIFDEDYFITPLSQFSFSFPNPKLASKEGLLAYGGGLEPNRLLNAYKLEFFHWFNKDDHILCGHQIIDLFYIQMNLKSQNLYLN